MGLDDYLEPEVAVTAVVAAAIFSPRGRQILRKGAVYGLAGLLVAGDALRNLGQGLQRAGATAGAATKTTWTQAQSAMSHDGDTGAEINRDQYREEPKNAGGQP